MNLYYVFILRIHIVYTYVRYIPAIQNKMLQVFIPETLHESFERNCLNNKYCLNISEN